MDFRGQGQINLSLKLSMAFVMIVNKNICVADGEQRVWESTAIGDTRPEKEADSVLGPLTHPFWFA